METRTWPIARSTQRAWCTLGLPQRLGDGLPYTKDSYHTFPSLEEVVGDHWCRAILATLLGDHGWVVWWTTTKVLKKSGLSGRAQAGLPDRLDLANPGGRLWIENFTWRGKALLLADLADREVAGLILEWSGGDTEFDAEFLFTPPGDGEIWEIAPIQHWCGARDNWLKNPLIF